MGGLRNLSEVAQQTGAESSGKSLELSPLKPAPPSGQVPTGELASGRYSKEAGVF